MDIDDDILLRRWLTERDADAFVQVAMRHAKMVYGVALRILGNSHDAEEVAQDCFEVLAGTTKPPKDNLSGWLYKVAANQAKKRIRSEQRRQEREDRFWDARSTELSKIPDVVWDDVYRLVDETILELPDLYREPLVAHFFEQETHEIIAQRLGVSRRTVGCRIHQGIEVLREGLKKRGVLVSLVALGTWFEVEATVLFAPSKQLAAQLARIGLSGAGRTAITSSSMSLPGKVGAMLNAKWIGGGIATVLLMGGAFVLGFRPQAPQSVPASTVSRDAEKEQATSIPQDVEQAKTTETTVLKSATTAVTTTVDDPLTSLWGWWLIEMKANNFPEAKYDEIEIRRDGNNMVLIPNRMPAKMTGPIKGLQIQVEGRIPSSSDQITFSGMFTPNAKSFQLNGIVKERGTTLSTVLTFTRLNADSDVVKKSTSQLSDDLRRQAEEGFDSQHDNWLSIRRLSARYRWSTRWMDNGEWMTRASDKVPRTGTMEYEMIPITPEEAKDLGHPLQLQLRWHVYDNETQWHATSNDIVRGEQKNVYWQEGHKSEKTSTPPFPRTLPCDLFSNIYTSMCMSYSDDRWSGSTHTREYYFEKIAPAMRLSTDEETENQLGGEKCYMFLPYRSQPRLWFSTNTGNLYQRDSWQSDQGVQVTHRYENYVQDPACKLSFPSRIIFTLIEGEDPNKKGLEYTVEFSDVRINPDLPPDTFRVE